MSVGPDTHDPGASASAPLRARVGRGLGALGLLLVIGAAAPGLAEAYAPARELWFARSTGLVASFALLCALAVTPLAGLFAGARARSLPPILRRALGMAAAWLALVHAAVAFVGPLRAEPGAWLQTDHLHAGSVALGVLLVLLLTSHASVVRLLRLRLWKELHRLAYVAALLVVQHVAMSPGADRRLVLALGGLVVALLLARAVPGARALWRD